MIGDNKAEIQARLDEVNAEGWRLAGVDRQEGEAAGDWIMFVDPPLHDKILKRRAKLLAELESTTTLVPPSPRG